MRRLRVPYRQLDRGLLGLLRVEEIVRGAIQAGPPRPWRRRACLCHSGLWRHHTTSVRRFVRTQAATVTKGTWIERQI